MEELPFGATTVWLRTGEHVITSKDVAKVLARQSEIDDDD